ncbi:GNAT family N-acetyltransferase [Acidobacteria bacterium AB60]|nr:GNAT family N-acetyltransferase [Acidobacteria bacterium AB60]
MTSDPLIPGGGTVRCTITTKFNVPHLAAAWESLWARANGQYHESFSVCLRAWDAIARAKNEELFCVQFWDGECLVLAWPLIRYRKGPLWMMRPLTPSGGEANSLLVDPQRSVNQLVSCAYKAVLAEARCDLLYLPLIRMSSPLYVLLADCVPEGRDVAPLARISQEPDWDTYSRAIGVGSWQQTERKRRRILQMNGAEFLWIDPKEEAELIPRLIDWMLLEKERWAIRVGKKHTWAGSAPYRDFLVSSVLDPDEIMSYRLAAIMVGDQPLAVKLIAICPGHVEYVIGAYSSDPAHAKLSPGLVLDEYWMRRVFDLKLDVDFGTGQEAYKLFWSRKNVEELRTYRIPLSLRGKLFLSTYKWFQRLRTDQD